MSFSSSSGEKLTVPFVLGDFEIAMVKAGGWVPFAAHKY